MGIHQADGKGWGRRGRKPLKRRMHRRERRKAKRDPECQPMYKAYRGYLL